MSLVDFWFALIAVLWIGYFFLEGFDFGVGILLPFLGRTENDKRVMINTIGPVWDGNEVWLLVAGGATFAAFPEWYATLFSGFYLALLLILLSRSSCAASRSSTAARSTPTAGGRNWDTRSLPRVGPAGPAVGRGLRQHRRGRADRRRSRVHRQPAGPCSTRSVCSAGW